MHTPRYTFNLVLQHPWVYALGGRTYGSDEVGVLNTCERYQLELQRWEPIAPLNFKRCTAIAFSWSNGIYVAGCIKICCYKLKMKNYLLKNIF